MARFEGCEQFVLGSCRCWKCLHGSPDPILPIRTLAPVFAYMNVLGALCAFAALHARPARFAQR